MNITKLCISLFTLSVVWLMILPANTFAIDCERLKKNPIVRLACENANRIDILFPLVINEVDYDQAGTDDAEFIELKNVSALPINLHLFAIELVNGATTPTVYGTIDLPDVFLDPGDYYVICGDSANVAICDLDVTPDTNLIQNGAPDAVALMKIGFLVDSVSYEGNTGGYTEVSGVGLVDDPSSDVSISRCPDGIDTNQNNVDFSQQPLTPGTENDCP